MFTSYSIQERLLILKELGAKHQSNYFTLLRRRYRDIVYRRLRRFGDNIAPECSRDAATGVVGTGNGQFSPRARLSLLTSTLPGIILHHVLA